MRSSTRRLGMESFESRQLMAADTSFDSRSGTLAITGSSAGDTVQINVLTPSQLDVWVNNRYTRLNPSAVRAIRMDLGAGTDRVEVNGITKDYLNVRTIDIKLGSGVNEQVWLALGSAERINVDATASRGANVGINTVVTDRFFVDMGADSDTGADTVRLLASDVNRFEARMGGGSDLVEVLGSTIENVKVNMGAGNDKFITSGADGYIGSGTIDGGAGTDTIDPLFKNRGRRFERVWSW